MTGVWMKRGEWRKWLWSRAVTARIKAPCAVIHRSGTGRGGNATTISGTHKLVADRTDDDVYDDLKENSPFVVQTGVLIV